MTQSKPASAREARRFAMSSSWIVFIEVPPDANRNPITWNRKTSDAALRLLKSTLAIYKIVCPAFAGQTHEYPLYGTRGFNCVKRPFGFLR